VLYLAVAVATVLVLGPAAARSRAPLGDLLAYGFGAAHGIAAVMAVLLTAGTMNAYFAGAAKLGSALGRDGALPAWLAHGSVAGEVPRRSLAVLTVASTVALIVVELADLDVRPLVLLTSAQLATVYAVGVAAALRLLPAGGTARPVALVACVAIVLLLAVVGPYLVWPAVLGIAAVMFVHRRHRRRVRLRTAVKLH
jgi:amino acid efflux transporter